MVISTIIPVKYCKIPKRAVIQAIYATTSAPYCRDLVRVRVLDVHRLAGRSKVATVKACNGWLCWDVWIWNLSNITAFIEEEVQ
jgi:hypothetical protein